MSKIRMVGGVAAGDEITTRGSRIRVAKHPDFSVCNDCISDSEIHITEYRIHKVYLGTGHIHFYATLGKVPLVAAFNELWYEYKKSREQK